MLGLGLQGIHTACLFVQSLRLWLRKEHQHKDALTTFVFIQMPIDEGALGTINNRRTEEEDPPPLLQMIRADPQPAQRAKKIFFLVEILV